MRDGYWGDPCKYDAYQAEMDFIPGPIDPQRMGHMLQIVDRIMRTENARRIPYLGLTIYPVGDRVYYATDESNRFYLEFKTPEMADHFASVLQGILLLSLSRFAMDDEREPSVIPSVKVTPPSESRWVRGFMNAA